MLTRTSHQGRVADGTRLATPLLKHQEEALSFMLERENGPIRKEYQLWKNMPVDGHTWYRHSIAGIKSKSTPTETGGGILADEMGMGKTLTMLALIVQSLKSAEDWCLDDQTHLTDGIPSSKMLSRATLVVAPSSSLLYTWVDEIQKRISMKIVIHQDADQLAVKQPTADNTLKVLLYYGKGRPDNAQSLNNYDIVLTTYQTLVSDYDKGQHPVAEIAWHRIVLDEAHFIRRSSTFLYKRVAELHAKFRWCLTGTPIQNQLDDVGALFAFLRIFPFDRLSMFRQCIIGPFMDFGPRRLLAQQNLAKLLDAYCIRRTKALLNLTNIFETTHSVVFSSEEQQQYKRRRKI